MTTKTNDSKKEKKSKSKKDLLIIVCNGLDILEIRSDQIIDKRLLIRIIHNDDKKFILAYDFLSLVQFNCLILPTSR